MFDFEALITNKIINRITSIEFIVSEKCQNACVYCYRNRRHNESKFIYITKQHLEKEIEGIKKLFDVDDDFFNSRYIEFFGGEGILFLDRFWNVAKYIIDRFPKTTLTVPTNARVLADNSLYDVEKMIQDLGPRVSYSLSVDSPYQDVNRPLSNFGKMMGHKEKIDYDRLFYLAHKYHMGFHPMFYPHTVNQWFNTAKFFIDNGFVPYMLEVRHPFTQEEMVEAVKQLVKIRNYLELKAQDSKIRRKANTLYASQTPRGLGCSALTSITIMPNGDIPFCHRLIDKPFIWANVFTQEVNWSLGVMFRAGFEHRNHPKCFACPIAKACNGPCPGMNYEYWKGSAWRPYDAFCDYTKLKYYVMFHLFDDWKRMIEQTSDVQRLKEYIESRFKDYKKDIDTLIQQ